MFEKLLNNTKWQVLLLASVIALIYLRTLSYSFIGIDENTLLIQKGAFNKEISNIPKAFSQHVFQTESNMESPGSLHFYRPLLTVSFILDSQFSRNQPSGEEDKGKGFSLFHFSNIFYHFIAVIGLLFVLLRMNIAPSLSFFFSLLFAVHPLLVQAIAWIPGRNDSLAGGFILWSFYFLLKEFPPTAIATSGNPLSKKKQIASHENNFSALTKGNPILNYCLHFLFFTLALFTKENTVLFVPLCIFYLFFIHKNKQNVKKILLLIACYSLVSALWFLIRKNAVGEITLPSAAENASPDSFYSVFINNAPLLLQYIQKTIIPIKLAVMASVHDTNYFLVVLALVIFGAGVYFTNKNNRKEVLFGLLWFVLFLAPTLLFSYFEGMEHRSYLPAIGLIIAFAHLDTIQNLAKNKNRLMGIAGMVIIIFALITINRLPAFSNELNYWKNAYETSEYSAVVCRDYGVSLTENGELQKAEEVFKEGIRRNPEIKLIHYNLGVLYYHTNRFEESKAQLLEELKINSTNFMLFHLLGVIYKQENQSEKAAGMWEQAVELNPNYTASYKELISFYAQNKDTVNFMRCKAALEKNGYRITGKTNQK